MFEYHITSLKHISNLFYYTNVSQTLYPTYYKLNGSNIDLTITIEEVLTLLSYIYMSKI
jgi:hypothetical protein